MKPKSEIKRNSYKIPLVASLGGCMEFYDFSLFIFMLHPISEAFFPGEPPSVSFYKTLLIFAVGYIMRPFGGLFFGHLGDRWGRKKAFQISLVLMSLTSFMIALIPGVAKIGWFSPLFLLSLRVLQGFALGGEIPGAAIFASEHFPRKRGLINGMLFLGITWGMLLASVVILILRGILSPVHFTEYGWRIGFIFGGFSGLLILWLRSSFSEPSIFIDFLAHKRKFPLVDLFRFSKKEVIQGILAMAMVSGSLFLMIRINDYINTFSKIQLENENIVSTYFFGVYGVFIFFSGWISDKIGRRMMMLIGCVSGGIGSIVFFFLLPGFSSYFEVFFWLTFWAITMSLCNGTFACFTIERFPTVYRFSGFAFCYNIGFASFGGIIPLFLTSLLGHLSSIIILIIYIFVLALTNFLSVLTSKDFFKEHLRF
ncbi:MAG: MFS transporter [Bacteroidales bacterium]